MIPDPSIFISIRAPLTTPASHPKMANCKQNQNSRPDPCLTLTVRNTTDCQGTTSSHLGTQRTLVPFVRGVPRLYVCQAPNAFICVSPCGSILGPFWVHFGSILGPFLGPFWVHFGSILGPFWVHFAFRQESIFR